MLWQRNLHKPNLKRISLLFHPHTDYSAKPKSKVMMLATRSARSLAA